MRTAPRSAPNARSLRPAREELRSARDVLYCAPGMNTSLPWSGWWRRRLPGPPGAVRDGRLSMVCNVCGARSTCPLDELQREAPPCPGCGSTVRQRAIIHLLSSHFFAASLALPDFPLQPDLRGAGMSDWEGFARPLARRLGYTNTYYHKEPRLDITQPPADWLGTLDFLISSDVLEHVAPPVSRAFVHARQLLKPGGLFLLTVPWVPDGDTREHFPDLFVYDLSGPETGTPVLRNRTRAGERQEFRDLVFHGGAGATLEMRMFSRAGVWRELTQAGFTNIRLHDADHLPFGIHWQHPWSLPLTAQAPA